jgi:hypothetical protein
VGLGQYVDNNGKIYRITKEDVLVKDGTLKPFWIGKKHNDESKKKMSNSALGKKLSEETKIKMSEYWTGKSKSENTKRKMSENAVGENNNYVKYLKKTGLPHHRSIKVGQYTIDNQLVKIWENCNKAAKDLGLSYKALNQCVNGRQKTSGGFIWKYI